MGFKGALAKVVEFDSKSSQFRDAGKSKNRITRSKKDPNLDLESEAIGHVLGPEPSGPVKKKMSAEAIEQLVLEHREHGKRLAWSFLSSWRICLNQDEVVSVVGAALCEAANRFDPDRGVEFKTFFFYHLRGMLLKEISRVIQEQRVLQFVPHHVVSGGTDADSHSNQSWSAFPIVDRNNPENILEKREVSTRCWAACAKLDELEREVLVRFFVHDEPLIEIAEKLNYCRCHISRVKSRALEKMGKLLTEVSMAPDGSIDELEIASGNERNSVRDLKNYTGGRGRRRILASRVRNELVKKKELRSVG